MAMVAKDKNMAIVSGADVDVDGSKSSAAARAPASSAGRPSFAAKARQLADTQDIEDHAKASEPFDLDRSSRSPRGRKAKPPRLGLRRKDGCTDPGDRERKHDNVMQNLAETCSTTMQSMGAAQMEFMSNMSTMMANMQNLMQAQQLMLHQQQQPSPTPPVVQAICPFDNSQASQSMGHPSPGSTPTSNHNQLPHVAGPEFLPPGLPNVDATVLATKLAEGVATALQHNDALKKAEAERLKAIPKKLPEAMNAPLKKIAQAHEKVVRAHAKAIKKEQQAKDDVEFYDKADNDLRYPGGIRTFKSAVSVTELDEDLIQTATEPSALTVPLAQGLTIREAMQSAPKNITAPTLRFGYV